MIYRVIQWYTGDIARRQMRYLAQRRDMKLVGAVVHSPDKADLDVGALIGADDMGVKTVLDIDSALSIPADCVLFNAPVWDARLVARILASGKNVLSTRGGWYPRHEEDYDLLQTAAISGGSSLMGAGNMPGLINDAIPLFAAGFTRNISRITTWQSSSPVLYGSKAGIAQLGIGQPPQEMADPAVAVVVPVYHAYFRQSAHLVAERLGQHLDDFRLTHWRIGVAPEDVRLDARDYTIRKGTVAAFEIGFTGFVADQPWYEHTVQHTWTYGLGHGWRNATEEPEWRVIVKGDPSLRMQMETVDAHDPWKSNDVLELNAARMVNLVPACCAAAPGCQVAFDQPMVYGTSVAPPRPVTNPLSTPSPAIDYVRPA